MNIAIGFSSKYFEAGCVAIKSLFENNQNVEQLSLFVIPQNLTEYHYSFLKHLASVYKREIIFIDTSVFDSLMRGKKVQMWYGSCISYSKLFADVLFLGVDRLIFIDADVFINSSLQPLWETDLEGKTIGAYQDFAKGYLFNAGVLLIDLMAWRSRGYRGLIDSKLAVVKTKFVEQDIFNQVFASDFKYLSIVYNLFPNFLLIGYDKFSKWPLKETLTKSQYSMLNETAVIIHYNFVGQALPFYEYDQITSQKWTKTHFALFQTNVTLTKKPTDRQANIAHFFRRLMPEKVYCGLKKWFYRTFLKSKK